MGSWECEESETCASIGQIFPPKSIVCGNKVGILFQHGGPAWSISKQLYKKGVS